MAGSFARDVVVERAGTGRYRAVLDHSWDLLPLPQGGVVAAFGLRAAACELDRPEQVLRTCTTVFAGQVAAGALEIDVQVLRRGRSASQVLVGVRNRGEATGLTTVAVYGGPRRGPAFVDVGPPPVPSPADCRSYRDEVPPGAPEPERPPFWDRIEGRTAIGHAPWEEHEPVGSDVATWLRYDEPPRAGDGTLDPLALMVLADRMPGSVGERTGHRGDPWFAPSADLTFHCFTPARTDWVLAHDRARWADGGWASAETTLWGEDGALVAYATQMMLFTYPPAPDPDSGAAPGGDSRDAASPRSRSQGAGQSSVRRSASLPPSTKTTEPQK